MTIHNLWGFSSFACKERSKKPRLKLKNNPLIGKTRPDKDCAALSFLRLRRSCVHVALLYPFLITLFSRFSRDCGLRFEAYVIRNSRIEKSNLYWGLFAVLVTKNKIKEEFCNFFTHFECFKGKSWIAK